MAEIVKVENVLKDYKLGKTIVPALRGVSVSVQEGEFLAIAGPSGSGKTTLLNIIGCIEQPTQGRVWIDGEDVSSLSSNELADIRARKLSFVFQNFNLLPVLTGVENVEYPLLLKKGMAPQDRKDRSLAALASVGLASFGNHRPLEMSGGQRQRVAIARAVVGQPRIVLADEPTANLDHKTGLDILDLMRELNEKHKTTFIISTHDPKVMEKATRVVKLFDGLVENK